MTAGLFMLYVVGAKLLWRMLAREVHSSWQLDVPLGLGVVGGIVGSQLVGVGLCGLRSLGMVVRLAPDQSRCCCALMARAAWP